MNVPGTDAINDAGKGMDQSFPNLPELPCVPCTIAKLKSQAHDAIEKARAAVPDPCAYLKEAHAKAQEQVAKAQSKVEEYHAIAVAQANQSESDFGGAVDMIPGAKDKHDKAKAYAKEGEDMYQKALDTAKKAEKMAADALAACEGMMAAPFDAANNAVDDGAQKATDAYKSVPVVGH